MKNLKNVKWLQRGLASSLVMGLAATGPAYAQDNGKWELRVTPEQAEQARAAGEADAADSGGPYALPTAKKIGIIILSAQSSATYRILNPVQELAARFGYEFIVCDPNFDAQKVAQCATSMVAQNADAVFSISTSPGPMGSALAEAGEKGVQWFGTLSGTEESPYIIPYGNPGVATAQLSAEWLFAEAAKRKGADAKLQFVLYTAPTVGLANLIEEQEVLAAAEQNPNIEIVNNHNLDLANIVQDTLSTTMQSIQQYPDLAGFWTVCDLCIPLIAQAVGGTGLSDEERPIIAGDFTTPQSVALLRDGKVDMLMDLPFEASVYVAFDQLLAFWSHEKPINKSYDVFATGYGLPFMEPYLLTKDNIGESGPIPVLGSDYKSYFDAKWAVEYGLE